MMWLGEHGNPLIWAGEIIEEEVETKDGGKRHMTLDELAQIAEYIDRYVEHALESTTKKEA